MKRWRLSGLFMAGVVFAVCQIVFLAFVPSPSCQKNLKEQSLGHKVRSIQYWGNEWRNKPLSQRLAPAPDDLIEKLRLENRIDGFREIPVPASPPQEFLAAIKQVESILPKPVAALAKDRIIGIFAVRDLGGSGYVESVLDDAGAEKYAFIVIDRDVLMKRKANEWATWKERSVFKSAPGNPVQLDVTIESGDNDSAQNAVVYILLHEIGHSLGMASCAHSSWTKKDVLPGPFSGLSWKVEDQGARSNFDEIFPERKSIKPYAFEDSTLGQDRIIPIYRMLNTGTNFPTIHAASGLWEDFAESFVNYIHVVMEKKPYEIRISRKNQTDVVYSSCWTSARCQNKRAFMKQWFADPLAHAEAACR